MIDTEDVDCKNLEKWGKTIPIVLILLAAVFFATRFNLTQLRGYLDRHAYMGYVMSILVYVLLGITPVPSDPVTLLLVAWKGPFVAVGLSTLGNSLAGIIEFYIGGSIGDLTDFEAKKKKLPFHLDRLPINSPAFLLLARMIPGFGPKFVSIASGVYKVSFLTFLWTTALSVFLGMVLLVSGGYGLLKLFVK